ncbi:hypothetical protein L1987_55791 [Smallanthus sonchifolius]|uniref:Uncharacterized protein n=1 Tax=Smallanthus sonchifolius TaxID=185202 RepID=A0ACB9EBB2_9ASTR|nr:hypothetical protein L1987_55791 [Smallanthus sonchifolius]
MVHKSIFFHCGGNLPLVVAVCPIEDMESQLDHERGPGKNKKKWNEKEDEKLVAVMLDVLNSAWNNTSGFGWDYNNDMLDAPQPVWQAYIQVHKNAAKWRGKKFPHYWDLCIVFGKDRANERDAQTAVDIIFDINREEPEATGDGLDDIDVDQPLNNPLDAASREESSTQRKRKRRNSWDPLVNSLRELAEIIGAEIGRLQIHSIEYLEQRGIA